MRLPWEKACAASIAAGQFDKLDFFLVKRAAKRRRSIHPLSAEEELAQPKNGSSDSSR
jgi:hypothetical protein